VGGYDVYEDPVAAKEQVGYLPEQPPLYTDMTPEEYLTFVGEARGLRGDALEKAVGTAIEKTGIGEMANRLIRNLSKGYRQRVGIAQAIITDPPVIILDEPTVGLDPRQIIEIRGLIRDLGKDHTVILSSHILTEIAEVCDTVIIMSKGRIVASDTLENLTKRYEGKNIVDLTVRGDEETVRRLVEGVPGIEDLEIGPAEEGRLHVRVSAPTGMDPREALFFRFADEKMPILTMAYEEVTLERVFLELTGGGQPEEKENEGNGPAAEKPEEGPAAGPDEEKPGEPGDDYTPLFGGGDGEEEA
jgi:ABC-2 type transport system ATP-binding protein